jgi:hypothetical protein
MRKLNKTIIAAAMASTFAFAAPAFAGSTIYQNGDQKLQLEGLFYLNMYSENYNPGTGAPKTDTLGLHTDRAYITLKYHFNKDWYARFTTDLGNEAGNLNHAQNVYVKYAYLEGKLADDAVVLRLGQSHTPWIDHEESLMHYRFIENTMSDKLNFDSSSDLGIGFYGKGLADGKVGYWITETDGHGYGNGTASKVMDFDSRISIYPIKGLEIAGQFRNGYRGTKTSANNGIESTFYQVMIDYGMDNTFRIGANYVNNKDDGKATPNTFKNHGGNITSGFAVAVPAIGSTVKSTGWDVWGWYNFPGTDFGLFGRYDYDENKSNFLNAGATLYKEKVTHYVVAAAYRPIKGLTFALAADNTEIKDQGGYAGQNPKDTRYGLYSQVSF